MRGLWFAGLLVAGLTGGTFGCGSNAAPEGGASSETDELSASASNYFFLQHDARKCAAPACGGYWVSRANRATTPCADGSNSAQCYVASLDWAGSGLGATSTSSIEGAIGADLYAARVILRGTLANKAVSGRPFGVLSVTEAWRAETDTDTSGVFYFANAPTTRLKATKLSNKSGHTFGTLDLSAAPDSSSRKARAQEEAADATGIIAAGALSSSSASATLSVDEFFLRVGGLEAGATCSAEAECAPGLLCCYPCGIRGCTNRCVQPTAAGRCPILD